MFSFNTIVPDLPVRSCAVSLSKLSYLKTLTENDWQGQMAGSSAWVIDCGLKWHQSFRGVWFLSQQLSLAVCLVKIQNCFAYFENSPCSSGTLCDTKRQKPDIPYPHICSSLILKNSCMPESIQHQWFIPSPLSLPLLPLFFALLYSSDQIPAITVTHRWSFNNLLMWCEVFQSHFQSLTPESFAMSPEITCTVWRNYCVTSQRCVVTLERGTAHTLSRSQLEHLHGIIMANGKNVL